MVIEKLEIKAINIFVTHFIKHVQIITSPAVCAIRVINEYIVEPILMLNDPI